MSPPGDDTSKTCERAVNGKPKIKKNRKLQGFFIANWYWELSGYLISLSSKSLVQADEWQRNPNEKQGLLSIYNNKKTRH